MPVSGDAPYLLLTSRQILLCAFRHRPTKSTRLIYSTDAGKTWSEPILLIASLAPTRVWSSCRMGASWCLLHGGLVRIFARSSWMRAGREFECCPKRGQIPLAKFGGRRGKMKPMQRVTAANGEKGAVEISDRLQLFVDSSIDRTVVWAAAHSPVPREVSSSL